MSFVLGAAVCLLALSPSAQEPSVRRDLERIVDAFHEREAFSGAVLVAEGAEVLYRGARGLAQVEHRVPNRPETRFRLASLAKPFNALLILRLAQEGLLSLDEELELYLPQLPEDIARAVRIEHLLGHRAGLYRDTLVPTDRNRHEHFTLRELVALIGAQDPIAAPGERYSYSSPGYVLLAAVAEAATGLAYGDALRQHLLEPLGLDHTGVLVDGAVVPGLACRYIQLVDQLHRAPHQDPSFATGAGDLYSTVDDLLKVSLALQSDEFLDAELRERAFRDHGSGMGLGFFVGRYGSGERFGREPGTVVHHGGGTSGVGTHLNIFLDHRITTVVLSNRTEIDTTDLSNRLANVALDLGVDLPHPNRRRDVLRALVGEGDPRQALAALGALQPRDRPRSGELFRLGFGLYENHRSEEARRIARFVAQTRTEAAWPWILLGKIDGDRDPARAAAAFREALQREPDSASARRGLQRAEGK